MAIRVPSNGVFGSSSEGGSSSEDASRKPRKKKEKSPEELGIKQCKIKMLKLLAMRDFTTHTMRERLMKAGFSQEVADEAIEYGVKSRFIDDKRFAQTFISQKIEAGYGQQRIEHELEKRGIRCADLPGYPYEYFEEDDELERALACLDAHHTNAKNARDSHFRFLVGRGFSPSVASRALRARGM